MTEEREKREEDGEHTEKKNQLKTGGIITLVKNKVKLSRGNSSLEMDTCFMCVDLI